VNAHTTHIPPGVAVEELDRAAPFSGHCQPRHRPQVLAVDEQQSMSRKGQGPVAHCELLNATAVQGNRRPPSRLAVPAGSSDSSHFQLRFQTVDVAGSSRDRRNVASFMILLTMTS
jgi:hypothetical protein